MENQVIRSIYLFMLLGIAAGCAGVQGRQCYSEEFRQHLEYGKEIDRYPGWSIDTLFSDVRGLIRFGTLWDAAQRDTSSSILTATRARTRSEELHLLAWHTKRFIIPAMATGGPKRYERIESHALVVVRFAPVNDSGTTRWALVHLFRQDGNQWNLHSISDTDWNALEWYSSRPSPREVERFLRFWSFECKCDYMPSRCRDVEILDADVIEGVWRKVLEIEPAVTYAP